MQLGVHLKMIQRGTQFLFTGYVTSFYRLQSVATLAGVGWSGRTLLRLSIELWLRRTRTPGTLMEYEKDNTKNGESPIALE